jgi:hypothetical protein
MEFESLTAGRKIQWEKKLKWWSSGQALPVYMLWLKSVKKRMIFS